MSSIYLSDVGALLSIESRVITDSIPILLKPICILLLLHRQHRYYSVMELSKCRPIASFIHIVTNFTITICSQQTTDTIHYLHNKYLTSYQCLLHFHKSSSFPRNTYCHNHMDKIKIQHYSISSKLPTKPSHDPCLLQLTFYIMTIFIFQPLAHLPFF